MIWKILCKFYKSWDLHTFFFTRGKMQAEMQSIWYNPHPAAISTRTNIHNESLCFQQHLSKHTSLLWRHSSFSSFHVIMFTKVVDSTVWTSVVWFGQTVNFPAVLGVHKHCVSTAYALSSHVMLNMCSVIWCAQWLLEITWSWRSSSDKHVYSKCLLNISLMSQSHKVFEWPKAITI